MKNSIKEVVLQKIKNGNIKQKPKLYFVLLSILYTGSIFISFFVMLYLISFTVLIFREQKILELLNLNNNQFMDFLNNIPFLIFGLIVGILITIIILIKRYKITYQQPFFYSILAVLSITTFLSILISTIDTDMVFARIGEQSSLPGIKHLHKHYRKIDYKKMVENKPVQ